MFDVGKADIPCERYLDGKCTFREVYTDSEDEANAVHLKHASCPYNHNDKLLFPVFGMVGEQRLVYKGRRDTGENMLQNTGRQVVRRNPEELPTPSPTYRRKPKTADKRSGVPCERILDKGFCVYHDANHCCYNHDIAELLAIFPNSTGLKRAKHQACLQHFLMSEKGVGKGCPLGSACGQTHERDTLGKVDCLRFLHDVCQLGEDCPMRHDTCERSIVQSEGAKEECVFCSESPESDGTDAIHLPCGHSFHSRCFEDWAARRRECPCCRAPLPDPASSPTSTKASQK